MGMLMPVTLPRLERANASFVTDRLLVGGDLDLYDNHRAVEQLGELLEVGVTHVVDCRYEADDAELFALVPEIDYLHHGTDDAGQRMPDQWFDTGVRYVLEALRLPESVVLTHCHMGINRGPSLGFASLLALGWDPVEAIDAIRTARPIANVWYAEDALSWHHRRNDVPFSHRAAERERLAAWRRAHPLDVVRIIADIRKGDRP
jgi:hypothetical protein